MANPKFNVPDGFKSSEEYETYCTCLWKAQPGDTALIYIHLNAPYPAVSNTTEEIAIVGRRIEPKGTVLNKFNMKLLLGSNNDYIGFWGMRNSFGTQEYNLYEPYISKFKYGYWGYHRDVRIARLFLKR